MAIVLAVDSQRVIQTNEDIPMADHSNSRDKGNPCSRDLPGHMREEDVQKL